MDPLNQYLDLNNTARIPSIKKTRIFKIKKKTNLIWLYTVPTQHHRLKPASTIIRRTNASPCKIRRKLFRNEIYKRSVIGTDIQTTLYNLKILQFNTRVSEK